MPSQRTKPSPLLAPFCGIVSRRALGLVLGRTSSSLLDTPVMMLLASAFVPSLNVHPGVMTSSTARAPAATMKVPQSMESAFVKSRKSLGIQAIPTELRAAIASTFPATGKTVTPAAITEAEVLECQAKWAAAIASISSTYAEKGDFVGAAGDAAGELYGCLSLSLAPAAYP